jgi:hypothetical protein
MAISQSSQYVLVKTQSASGGGGVTRLLNAGGGAFIGTRAVVTFSAGQVVIVRCWWRYTTGATGGKAQFSLYLSTADDLSGMIADTGLVPLGPNQTNLNFQLYFMFTIQTDGASGTLWANGALTTVSYSNPNASASLRAYPNNSNFP